MKSKNNLFWILLVLAFNLGSYVFGQASFPPIQSFLNKIEGKSFDDDVWPSQMISQTISNSSVVVMQRTLDTQRDSKKVYTDIDWNNFTKVNVFDLKNEDKYVPLGFYFSKNITWTLFDENGKDYSTGKKEYFIVYIFQKDLKKCLKVINDWKNSR